ncbi:XrtA/PEP-CTERM system amidotransferase [Echinimonas agarilytica]|uniref:asparagine synthase (glutamine-hydrolyzing) n=1 Tax=Echinimonas agarilytica TaxID=1215918 RepID=A0AA42BAX7_9GAMM|nr:XrtA/PEP-CTERM system amidotransferase [Echinimonas agarilytica]MCM2681476.1 amidotransferase 1, exosortase A system-associated [Echinimonas agarilytica]
MCGIAGVFQLDSRRDPVIDQDLLAKMTREQSHRGPDDEGFFVAPNIGLAHRRLSVIDLAGGHQPIFSQDGNIVTVFNGEIYNYRELRTELQEQYGFRFVTSSDTEVIVYAWLAWGESCVERFRGMFTFAVWDKLKKTLFIARDRLGIKPLFYTQLSNGQLYFASELKVILAHPELDKEIRPSAIEDFFGLGYIPEPDTIFKNVHKLPAGHTMFLQADKRPRISQYWDVPSSDPELSEKEAQEEIMERIKEAVQIRMVADVPLGSFLSGGVDSSAVVAMMAQSQDAPITTCSIGFDSPEFNETEFAQQVADRYKTDHHVQVVDSNDFSIIDRLIDLYDEPYGDISALPTYRVCELARKHVTVALSGDGGDEIFAGYRRHKFHMAEEKLRSKMPYSFRKAVFGPLGKLYPKADWAPQIFRAKTTFQSLAMDSASAYCHSVSKISDANRSKLYSQSLKNKLNGHHMSSHFTKYAEQAPTDDPLKMVQYLDLKTWLVDDILTKVDRASMAHALEVRVPLLDHKLIEWAWRIPSSMNLKDGEGKALFKKQLEPHVPHDTLYRKKMGFSVPVSKWFRNELKGELSKRLLSERMLDSGHFQADTIKKAIADHQSGVANNETMLWQLYMFEGFLRQKAD